MGLPAIMGAISLGSKLVGGIKKAKGAVKTIAKKAKIPKLGLPGLIRPTYRRRKKKATLSMEEIGKLMIIGQALGKRSPAVTLMTMKALSGRL